MKKIVFLASLMCATMAMAAPSITATSQIDLATAGQTDKYVRFVLSSSFSNDFDNNWDTPAPNESGIYVLYNNNRYTGWASNEYSDNLVLGFYTGDNLSYTLKFSNFAGGEDGEYSIYDIVAKQTIVVNASTPDYNFTIDESQKNSQINNRFVINYAPDVQFACFINKVLEIHDSPYSTGKIVIEKDGVGITGSPFNGYENVDLTSLPNDGSRYVVKFFKTADVSGTPARQFVIVVPEIVP